MTCYNADNLDERKETERFRCFPVADLLARDKTNLDITWIKQTQDDDDVTLDELITTMKAKSRAIADAVGRIEELMKGIEES